MYVGLTIPKVQCGQSKRFFFLQTLGHDGWLNLNLRNPHGRITKISEWHGEKRELVCRWREPSGAFLVGRG